MHRTPARLVHNSLLRLTEPLSGSAKLFADAASEEDDQVPRHGGQDPNDPIWTGEERVHDIMLRMIMDKYKPLRIRTDKPVEDKLKSVQQPQAPAAKVSSVAKDGGKASTPGEDGRRLPKTPDQKPWAAVYVRPADLCGYEPSIYYGQFLKSTITSSPRQRLKADGVNVNNLPLDDPKAMRQLREGVRKIERIGKLSRAREGALDYKLDKMEEAEAEEGTLLSMGGGATDYAGVVEERIRAAQDAGLFKNNRLRGKPIARDINERNPFLNQEEFFMNRIVMRQGAAPPWVQLNAQYEQELVHFRQRIDEAWTRRASRMILSGPLRRGMQPLPSPASEGHNFPSVDLSLSPTQEGAEAKLIWEIPATRTAGEQRLLEIASRYRDPEWAERENAYHRHQVHRLNELIRKHNHLAPFSARKGLLSLRVELEAMYIRAVPLLVDRLSEGLRQNGNPTPAREGESGHEMYDIWGRSVKRKMVDAKVKDADETGDGWFGNSTADRSGTESGASVGMQDPSRTRDSQGLGLLIALRRSIDWAREKVGL